MARFVQMSDASGEVLPKASNEVTFTLTAAGWTNPVSPETYYTQTVTGVSPLITATINGVFGLSRAATNEQYEAAADAQIRCTGQSGDNGGTIEVKAKEKPSVDLPCVIVLLG